MCAKADDVIEPLQPPTGAVPGDVVSFDKFPGAVAVVLCGGFFRGMGGGWGRREECGIKASMELLVLARSLSLFFSRCLFVCE